MWELVVIIISNIKMHCDCKINDCFLSQHRSPVASNRPGFREILLSLLGNPEDMLSIPQEALDAHPLAGLLGSPLEAGENMYPDLHNQYFTDQD